MKKLGEVTRLGGLHTVQRDAPVLEAVRVMTAHEVGMVGVLDGNRLVGIFSERDVVRRVVARQLDPAFTWVGDAMTTGVISAEADEDCPAALRRMEEAKVGHLLVLSEGRVLSIVSIRDLIRIGREDTADPASLRGLASI
jgi:CBS domain-containing protein